MSAAAVQSLPNAQPRPLVRWLLFAFTLLMGIGVGGAILTTVVIFPAWTASPEAATSWPDTVNEGLFFVFVSPLLFLLSLATLIASWRVAPPLRKWIRIATIIYILIFIVTMLYFVPGQLAMKGAAGARIPAAELGSMLRRWVALNWVRQGAGVLAFGAALHALGLSYRMTGGK